MYRKADTRSAVTAARASENGKSTVGNRWHVGARELKVGWIAMTGHDQLSESFDEDQGKSASRPAGTLVIRTWGGSQQEPAFRARVVYSQGPDGEPTMVTTADPVEILSIVREWLSTQAGSPDSA